MMTHHFPKSLSLIMQWMQILAVTTVMVTLPVIASSQDATLNTPSSGKTQEKTMILTMTTSHGDVTIELNAEKAPITVENFLRYVDEGFFDGTIFHRVIPGFMIQGGGMTAEMIQKRGYSSIKNEADNGLKNLRGTLAMARTADINSATSQFFINLKDNAFLDHGSRDFGYAVFGKVFQGMDVVDTIAGVKTGNKGMHQDVPVEPVLIIKMIRKEN
jgi:peptidyl-prolyl cis-trans isomerase A (cyclophilin A)